MSWILAEAQHADPGKNRVVLENPAEVRTPDTAQTAVLSAEHAREASRLFNATGRQRRMRIDALIAATSIVSNAHLATSNRTDFLPFTALGLRLAEQSNAGTSA